MQNWVVVLTNISILKDAEERVRKALQKEMHLGEMKSKFVSMASHEFRTPLAGIVTSIDLVRLLLEKNGNLNDSIERHLEKAMGEINRLTHLMDNLLLAGKVDSGKIAFKPAKQDLVKFIHDYHEEVKALWPNRKIVLELESKSIKAEFDDKLMRHILSNLLSNAFKYSPSNQPVTIRLKSHKSQVCIEVIDQGIGIPNHELQQLFQSFYRASNAEHIDGPGMGLVIVRQFVELHGGTVHITSEENHGCNVEICLPMKTTHYE
jgi:signal transduction histidine kinase